ncbi:cysteine dioxygenase [Streptomyces hoynatensis]|uniref:Cupin domain-containing protein n=1 Tax=Streptomyces hoynatensis TaxID=1141874 RepID=A0A3A9YMQ1_9ACTN|nr:cysteine dioxygenase family protein [Streptomyces hoynatensis]RKN37412.1 cupin domain-containing protein [Streptomyces hoynatensis]
MNSDNEIAGDPSMVPHLLPQGRSEHPGTVAEFAALATALAGDRECWAPLVGYDAASRWYHRLRTGPGYEVWLLSWLPGQDSGRHDHGPSHGVFTVLDGALTEHADGRGTRVLTPGSLRVFAPGYRHEVVNAALVPAVSLHVYFPGLTEMTMHPRARDLSRGTPAQGGSGAPGAPVPRAPSAC